jgi:hypothetical protein
MSPQHAPRWCLSVALIALVIGAFTACADPSNEATHRTSSSKLTAHRANSSPSPTSSSIDISPDIGESFQPVTPVPVQESAENAWDQFQRQDSGTAIPGNISSQLGYLSVPLSTATPEPSETGGISNDLVWGFSFQSQCVSTLPTSTPSNQSCVRWVFLSAEDGSFVFSSFQKLGG